MRGREDDIHATAAARCVEQRIRHGAVDVSSTLHLRYLSAAAAAYSTVSNEEGSCATRIALEPVLQMNRSRLRCHRVHGFQAQGRALRVAIATVLVVVDGAAGHQGGDQLRGRRSVAGVAAAVGHLERVRIVVRPLHHLLRVAAVVTLVVAVVIAPAEVKSCSCSIKQIMSSSSRIHESLSGHRKLTLESSN